jgi:hypothetical protein
MFHSKEKEEDAMDVSSRFCKSLLRSYLSPYQTTQTESDLRSSINIWRKTMKQIALGQEVNISSKRKGRRGRKPSNCDLSLICTILLNRRSIVQSLANLLGSTTTFTSRENAIAGAPKRATAGAFWCDGDPNAGGNSYRWRILLFAGGKVIYYWRIVLCTRGKLFHWQMRLCARDKRALRWRILMRQGQCFYASTKIIAAVKNKILYSK